MRVLVKNNWSVLQTSSVSMSTEYAGRLLDRCDTFSEVTSTNKSLRLTMVTSAGLVHNAGWQNINNEVDTDDLFRA